MDNIGDHCKDCANNRHDEPEQNPSCAATDSPKLDPEAEAACGRTYWDHLDTRMLFRTGYFRFPW